MRKPVTTNAQQPVPEAVTLYRPLVEKVVGALGALVTHQVAYLLVSLVGLRFTALSDHGHLSTQWAVVAPIAVGAATAFIVWQLRGLGFRSNMSVRHLSGVIAAFFVAQETIEGMLGGHSPLQVITHPAVIAGLFIAPLVAWVLTRAMAGMTELAAKLLATATYGYPRDRAQLIPVPVRYNSAQTGNRSRPRAPPSSLRN